MKVAPLKFIKNWLGSNWNIKILAFILALVLWLYVRGEQEAEVIFSVPLQFINLPSQYVLVYKSSDNVSLTIRARQNVILGLSSNQFRVECDLKDARLGDNRYSINSEKIIAPSGIRIVGINPPYVKVKLDLRR